MVKQWKKLRNRIYIILISNKKDYLKWTSKPNLNVIKKIFDSDLVAARKGKFTLKLNKPA